MSELTVGPDTQVTLNFSIELLDGAVVDSNFGKPPATFVVGDGNLLPGFEEALFGMTAGEEKSMRLTQDQAFGPTNPDNVQRIALDQFAEEPSPGLIVSFADAAGSELPGVVDRIEGDQVYVDFNHPLAGREIVFRAAVVAVVPAPEKLQ